MRLNVMENQRRRDINNVRGRDPNIEITANERAIRGSRTKLASMYSKTNERLPRVENMFPKCVEKLRRHNASRKNVLARKPSNRPNVWSAVRLTHVTQVCVIHVVLQTG